MAYRCTHSCSRPGDKPHTLDDSNLITVACDNPENENRMLTTVEKARLTGLRWISSPFMRPGKSAGISILIYHRVLARPDPMLEEVPDAMEFERQMALLSGFFTVLPLSEAIERLNAGRLPRLAACVTFDDGYADNAEVALPILRRWEIPATFFISTAFLNGTCMWNDAIIESVRSARGSLLDLRSIGHECYSIGSIEERRQVVSKLLASLKYLSPGDRQDQVKRVANIASVELPEGMMMTQEQVRELANAGMEIGGHTVSHPILSSVKDDVARDEIAQGIEELFSISGRRIRYFAYPNGKPGKDYRSRDVEIVRSLGLEAAVTTAWGAARQGADLFQLPRFTPWDRGPERFMLRLMKNQLMQRIETV